jgi:lipoate-protein ligase A
MLRLGLLVEPEADPAASSARDRGLLALAAADRVGFLRVYTLKADTLVLGRYHRRPLVSRVPLARRLAGGRVAPGGPGFVGVSLVLPHRAALVADDPLALAPEQVMNRCVRGILAGLEALGVPALYPGRETITAGGRLLGLLAFDVDERGACLFEAVLAVGSELDVLPPLLDRADPDGVVAAALILPGDATSVARALGRVPALDEIAALLARGYAARFDVRVEPTSASPAVDADGAWIDWRSPRPELDRHARAAIMVGTLEAHAALAPDGRLAAVELAGDLIADSPGVARLEAELAGVRAAAAEVHRIVEAAFCGPVHFALGVGPLRTITDTIVRAVA